MDQNTLQKALGYTFSNPELLDLALTHSSWAHEHNDTADNERIEFLGDAVLELCVSAELYFRFPHGREGDLTKLRSQLVNTAMLAKLARELKIDHELCLGRGEEQQGGRKRDSLLADAMEAVLGGIFLDGGYDAALGFVRRMFEKHWPSTIEPSGQKDYKSRLQEVTQQALKTLPVYTLKGSDGPEHDKIFSVEVALPDGRSWMGCASSVKRAEHEAARLALEALEHPADEA